MTERAQLLHNYMMEHQDRFLKLLQQLVEFETPSDAPASFSEPFKLLSDHFTGLGYTVEHLEGQTSGGQLLMKPQKFTSSTPSQLIIGHLDTVWKVGTLSEMPFKMEGNSVSGPGTYDMKAGITMIAFALEALQELQIAYPIQPVVLINTDEEVGSADSESRIITEARKAERTYVLEPSLGAEGKIKTERKGVGEYEIVVTGKPSHSGLAPDEGISAILGLSHIVQQLFRLNEPQRGITVNVGTIEGGERSNVIAAQSKALVDVRIPTRKDGVYIDNTIRNLEPEIEGVDVQISGGINRPPLEKNDANQILWQKVQALGRELDLELQEGRSGGASDGNYTNDHSPTLDGLGAVGEGAHAYHEKILLKETLQRTALLSLLIQMPSLASLSLPGD